MTSITPHDADYHAARILLILAAFDEMLNTPFEGLTKLAKVDFLLRYPRHMREFLQARGVSVPDGLIPSARENATVESPMIRYRHGPWDQGYYVVIGRMVALGLIRQARGPAKLMRLELTPLGRERAERVSAQDNWSLTWHRAQILASALRDINGTQLKTALYEQFDDLMDQPHWSVLE
jgi:hypothetical protein